MSLPENFVQSLRGMTQREVLADVPKVRLLRPLGSLEMRNEVRPADLYCYLFARFGAPNGFQNLLRNDSSDNLFHWEWMLRHDAGAVTFLGMNFRTEINIFGLEADSGDVETLAQQLKSDFAAHGEAMRQVRSGLQDWIEFVNPYQRIKRAVERLRHDLEQLNLRPEEERVDSVWEAEGATHSLERFSELANRYSRGLGLCFGIRSMLPVMAEAFVNLLLYILMRPELRADSRLSENAFRQPIDVRIKSLSINCRGFSQQPDYTSGACKAYQTLVNERNDLLHGNVVIGKLKFNEVYFSGNVPIFKEYRTLWQRSLQLEADAVGLSEVMSELAIVQGLRDYLLSCVDERLRERLAFMADRHELGLSKDNGRVGVLFSGELVDVRSRGPATETASVEQPDESSS